MVVIGRDAEVEALLASVDRLDGKGPASATVVAPPGMGKSALAAAFRSALAGRDATVLTARPLEAEARLAFSGLGELLGSLPQEEYDALPPPQRTAIRSALLLDDGDASEPRAVAAALRGVIAARAADRPVVILVDDAQWLDDASAAALAQALPRLPQVPVLVVAWARPSGRPLEEWLPDWPRTEVELPPLPISALFHVIRAHLDLTLSRGELRAVEQASGGNPLHALEFARHRAVGPGASFEALLADRVLSLPRPTRRVLLAAALSPAPTVSRLAEALDRSVDDVLDDLEPAVADRLIRAGARISFLHPLYLEATVDGAAAEERAALHRALAAVEPLAEVRVRHLALADDSPNETLATELTVAADQAWDRAAWEAATQLLRLAVDRSEDSRARDERALTLAEKLVTNGNARDAEQVLLTLRTASAAAYWPATVELCKLYSLDERYDDARELARELDAADLTPEDYAAAVVHAELDLLLGRTEQQLDSYAEAHRRLAEVPDHPGLSRLRAEVLVPYAYSRYQAALPFQHLLDEAIEHDRREPGERMIYRPIMLEAVRQMTSGRYAEARVNFDEILRASVEVGDDLSLPVIQSYRASLETRACRFALARRHVEDGLVVAEASMRFYLPMLTNILVSIDAHLGDHERALARSDEVRELLGAIEDPTQEATWSVGRLAALVAAGRTDEAYELSVRVRALAERLGLRHPADPMIHINILETMVATGRLDEAEDYLADVRARAAQIDLHAVLAETARFEVAVAASRGDLDAAAAMVPAMLAGLDELPQGMEVQPVERAQAWWTAGKVYRRGRLRRQATEALETAIALFADVGCAGRAERARADLARSGRRRTDGAALTEGELAVARAAAEGRRNNEIADELFLSPKTVEAMLTRSYRKLGIRSRVELAAALDKMPTGE